MRELTRLLIICLFSVIGGALVALIVMYKFSCSANAQPKNKFYRGPIEAAIIRVVDADTILVRVYPWPSITVTTSVRLRGVDTPEIWQAKCKAERDLAKRATSYVRSVARPGDVVELIDVSFGKYAGRVVAGLILEAPNGKQSLSEVLLSAGYAKPYHHGKRKGWCPQNKN